MTDFTSINKMESAILSLKTSLEKCSDLLEVDNIYDQIQNYEQLILKERKKDSINLQNEYKQVGDLKKQLEKQLDAVDKSYDMLRFKMEAHVSIYASRLSSRIGQLETDISDRKAKLASDEKEASAKK